MIFERMYENICYKKKAFVFNKFLEIIEKISYKIGRKFSRCKIEYLILLEIMQVLQIYRISKNFLNIFNLKQKEETCFTSYYRNLNQKKKIILTIYSKIVKIFTNCFQENLHILIKKKKLENMEIPKVNFWKSKKEANLKGNYRNVSGNISFDKLKKISHKALSFFFNLNLPEHQQNQGYFDTRSRRVNKFSTIWDESVWISFVFNHYDYDVNMNFDLILNFLENVFMILVYIQTCKFKSYFFDYIQNKCKTLIVECSNQLVLLYNIFLLDRKWNNHTSIRDKTSNIIKHLEYTTDLAFDDFLNLRRMNLNWNKNKTIQTNFGKFIKSFVLNSKNKIALIDFVLMNIPIWPYVFSKKIFISNVPKIFVYYEIIRLSQKILLDFKYDIRFWYSSCIDSYFLKINNKTSYGLFLIINTKIKTFSFGFLLSDIFKKILQFLPFENIKIISKQVKKSEIMSYSMKDLVENFWKFKSKEKGDLSIMSIVVYSKKKFTQEVKFFLKKLFGFSNLHIISILFNSIYYFSSYLCMEEYKQFFSFEIKLNLIENIISKFYKLFIIHGSNPFLRNKEDDIMNSKNICFIKIFDKNKLNANERVIIYLSIGINGRLKNIRKFKMLLKKNTFFEIVVFFCAKYRANFIIMEVNSFIERSASVFLKLKLSDKDNFKKMYGNSLRNLKNKRNFFNYVKILTIEKDSILCQLTNSWIIQTLYSNYSYRLMYLVLKLLEENIMIYFYFLSGQKFNLCLKINHESYYFKFSLIYKILSFIFWYIFSKVEVDLVFCISRKEKRPLLRLTNIFGIRNGEKLCKEFSSFYRIKNKKKFSKFNKNTLKSKSFNSDHKFYFLSLIYLGHPSNFNNYRKFFFDCDKYGEEREDFLNLFNYPLLLREVKQKFLKKFSEKKLLKIINKKKKCYLNEKHCDFFSFINISVLQKSFLYLVRIYQRKLRPYFSYFGNKIEKIYFCKKNLCVKNWKEKILTYHRLGQLVLIGNVKKIYKDFLYGILETGFNYFISLKDITQFTLNFPNFIRKTFCSFPAKITAIYPKIMQIRLSINIRKNYNLLGN
nr:CPARA_3gp364 [Cryptomonas sp.]